MSEFLAFAHHICWLGLSLHKENRTIQQAASRRLLIIVFAFAGTLITGILWSPPIVEAAKCGANNQRPCKIWERIPSCNKGLYEDFKKGRCLAKTVPGRDCGRKNQRPCKVWERIPSCNKDLVEDFKKGRCVAKAVPGRDCGRANQRPCTILERIPSCNTNLKEDFGKGICVAVNCGKKYGRPCTVVERIPSCDSGLVEDFLKGKCVPSADSERHRIAGEKLKEIGGFVASKVGFATQVANNPQVRESLNSEDKTSVARVVNASGAGEKQMPDGYLLRTLTVGATVGGKVLFVGTSGGAGAAIDFKGERPAYAYATGDYSFGPGLAAGGGIDVGFWVCQNNKIGGDSWGVEFGVDDLAAAYVGAASLKKGPSLGIGLWFDYNKPPVFQGFTITPGFGIGADFGGVVKAATAVQDDASVECDGRPKAGLNRRPNATMQQESAIPKSSSSIGTKTFIQQIQFKGGLIRQHKVVKKAPRPDVVRIGLEDHTEQPTAVTHGIYGINPLTARTNGSLSCANFSARLRLPFQFVDRGIVKKKDVMSLKYFAGDIVVFEWLRDN